MESNSTAKKGKSYICIEDWKKICTSLRNEAYNKAIEWKRSHSLNDPYYEEVSILLQQFNNGIEPKKELLDLMVKLGVMSYD